jgi:hypothetical protein
MFVALTGNEEVLCEILGPYGGKDEDDVLGCDATQKTNIVKKLSSLS